MTLRPTSLLAILLIVAQSVLTLGAGRTLCLPLSECGHRASTITPSSVLPCSGDCSHRHDAVASATTTPYAADPADPFPASEDHPDCGCHLHLPIPDRNESARAGSGVELVRLARCPASIPASVASFRPSPPPWCGAGDPDAWLGSDQIRARRTTSMRV